MYHQNQKFEYEELVEINHAGLVYEKRHYLLMPNEVEEFKRLQSPEYGLSFEYAFERVTTKDYTKMINIRLVVEFTEKNINETIPVYSAEFLSLPEGNKWCIFLNDKLFCEIIETNFEIFKENFKLPIEIKQN